MTTPEAEVFAAIAGEREVPRGHMLVESRSTDAGENVSVHAAACWPSAASICGASSSCRSRSLERRTFATFKKVWPEPAIAVTSPQVTMDDYLRAYSNESLSPADVVSIMVGDLQRIGVYAERGFQVPQEIPDDVWRAYEELRGARVRFEDLGVNLEAPRIAGTAG